MAVQYIYNNNPKVKSAYNAETPFTTVANPMADAFAGIVVGAWGTKHFVFTGATNNLNVQILGSIDGGVTYPFTAVSSFSVTSAGTAVTQTITTPYTHLKVQVAPAVGGAHGTLTTKWFLGAPY